MTKPLEGIRVLDLTRLVPGAVCTLMLADMGADVIKIEDPNGGDYARWMPPLVDGLGVFFRVNNRNKRSVVIDLKHEEGQAVFRRLVAQADVLIEGFRPGVMAKFNADYPHLREVNPRLVYCSLSGWGQDGPYASRSGHDLNYVSISGLTGATLSPQPPGGQMGDIGASYAGVAGVLAALLRRERSGEGGYIDIALSEAALPFVMLQWAEAVAKGVDGGQGTLTGGLACYRIYETADGKYVALAALEPKFWANFCQAVGQESWSTSDYQAADKQPQLIAEVTALFRSKTQAEWCELLDDADCCFSIVNPPKDVHHHPHIQARGMMGVDENGTPWMRSPIHIDGNSATQVPNSPIPQYGEHTRPILREVGYSDEAINRLQSAGVIRCGGEE